MTTKTQDAQEFFYQHAGWSYDPKKETPEEGRRNCARELARAEEWGKEQGIEFVWEDDWSLSMSHADYYSAEAYPSGDPETCESCVAYLDGEHVGSLGCIDGATPEYRRVVEAELAIEARDEQRVANPSLMHTPEQRKAIAWRELTEHSYDHKRRDPDNCAACAHQEQPPNVAGWLRVWIAAGQTIPAEFFVAEIREALKENRSYLGAILEEIKVFGVRVEA